MYCPFICPVLEPTFDFSCNYKYLAKRPRKCPRQCFGKRPGNLLETDLESVLESAWTLGIALENLEHVLDNATNVFQNAARTLAENEVYDSCNIHIYFSNLATVAQSDSIGLLGCAPESSLSPHMGCARILVSP